MNTVPYIFILAGGRGERLWPLSSEACRKPFLKLFEEQSLLALTLRRVEGLVPRTHIRILTTADLREAVLHALPDFPETQLLCEPEARNTAAALAYACGHLQQISPEAIGIVLPADHLIRDDKTFQAALRAACHLAQTRHELVTLGISPTTPATTYGYIACGEALETVADCQTCQGIGFTEKPDLSTAKTYLHAGNFLWNAGIFIWEAATLKARFTADAPAFLPLIEAPEAAAACYPTLPKIAFDYAIMEHCPNFSVVRGTFDWDDIGTLEAIERQQPCDSAGNRTLGEVTCIHTADTTVLTTATGHRLILSDVTNLFVAQTPEATFICPRDCVTAAQKQAFDEINLHTQRTLHPANEDQP